MSLVVSDNSPLNLMIRLRQEAVLPALFGQVVIPSEVEREMKHAKAPEEVRAFLASPPAWLLVRDPSRPMTFPTLDPGEAAAIALAVELAAPLLIDERKGREIATANGLAVVGAIGVLERAAGVGLVPDLRAIYADIRSHRFHVAENILAASMARHEQTTASPKG